MNTGVFYHLPNHISHEHGKRGRSNRGRSSAPEFTSYGGELSAVCLLLPVIDNILSANTSSFVLGRMRDMINAISKTKKDKGIFANDRQEI